MAWLESHQQLERHPKTHALMNMMGWDIDTTIGKLHRFWWWVLDFAPTGDLSKLSHPIISASVGLSADSSEKYVQSMILAGWLDRSEVVFRVHDWPHYAGRYLKDSKFKRRPEKWDEVLRLYELDCPQTVHGLSPLPNLTNPPTINKQQARPVSVEEAVEYGKAKPGYDSETIRHWFGQRDSQSWQKTSGIPITNWRSDLDAWVIGQRHRPNGGKSRRTEQDRDRENTGLDEQIKLKRL